MCYNAVRFALFFNTGIGSMNELWLAFEGGGTHTRMLLADTELRVIAREVGGPASPLYARPRPYARQIRTRLDRLKWAAADAGGRVTVAGMAGPMMASLVEDLIQTAFGKIPVIREGEMEIALALYDLSHGVSLVAGTGASVRAINERGKTIGFGGLGPQFGDEGCGYWIGREAIAAAMRARQNREPDTLLTDALCAFYEIGRIHDILKFCDRSGHVPAPKVAACVPVVFDIARESDAAALRICRAAGRALGRLAVAVTERSGTRKRIIPIVLTGGVFHGGPLILRSLTEVLRKSRFRFEVYPPVPEPTVGLLKRIKQHRKLSAHRSVPVEGT